MTKLKMRARRGVAELTVILMLPVVGAVAGHWMWGKQAEYALLRQVQEYRRAGEPVLPADLAVPPLAKEENAALDFQAAAIAIDPQSLRQDWMSRSFSERLLSDAEMGQIEQVIKAHPQALASVQAAGIKTRFDWGIAVTSPMLTVRLPELGRQRSLGRVLVAIASYSHQTADDSQAVERLLEVLHLSRGLEQQQWLIGWLVGQSVAGNAAEAAGAFAPDLIVGADEVANNTVASRAEVKALVARLLDEKRDREALKAVLWAERVGVMDTAQCLVEGRLDFGGREPRPEERLEAAVRGFIVKPFILDDAAIIMRHVEEMAGIVEAPDWPSCQKRIPKIPAEVQAHPMRHAMARMFMAGYERVLLAGYRSMALRRLGATALAVRLYATEHDGRLPGKLSDLVPDYLPAVPADPFAGGGTALAYFPQENPPVLYSVGEQEGEQAEGMVVELNSRFKMK